MKANRERRKAALLCVWCGASSNTVYCRRCEDKRAAQRDLRRARKRAAGICYSCSQPADDGYSYCAGHRALHAQRHRAHRVDRKAVGFCVRNGCEREPAAGHTLCEPHLELLRVQTATRTRARQSDELLRFLLDAPLRLVGSRGPRSVTAT